MKDRYLPADTYARLISALAALTPSRFDPTRLDPDQIKMTLGEFGGIWPVTIREATKKV